MNNFHSYSYIDTDGNSNIVNWGFSEDGEFISQLIKIDLEFKEEKNYEVCRNNW